MVSAWLHFSHASGTKRDLHVGMSLFGTSKASSSCCSSGSPGAGVGVSFGLSSSSFASTSSDSSLSCSAIAASLAFLSLSSLRATACSAAPTSLLFCGKASLRFLSLNLAPAARNAASRSLWSNCFKLLFLRERFDDILFILAANSFDLNGFGAAWNESVSAIEGGAGVAEVEAEAEPPKADERDLKLDLCRQRDENRSALLL